MIIQAYGPLVLFSKKEDPPIFNIHNIDNNEKFNSLLRHRETVPQPIKVKIVSARCLKDKIGSGHFILMCSVMDRLGGKKISYNLNECEESLRDLSQNFRQYSLSKAKFMNRAHREMEKI